MIRQHIYLEEKRQTVEIKSNKLFKSTKLHIKTGAGK